MTSTLTPRPAGLGYSDAGKERYDPRKDIPSDALDAKDFTSIDAWLDACIAQDKAGKIGSGTYDVDGTARYAPKGIYGYGETPPKFVAQKVDCWLYLKDQDVALKGLQFEGFGQVLGGAVPLSANHPHHSTTKYGFDRFEPVGKGGTGLELKLAASTKTTGPAVDISDNVFVDCENVFTFVSDTTKMGRVDFDDNVLTGTYGMLDIDSLYWTEVNASGNEWSDATGSRAQPNLKQNGVQTGFKIGTDSYVPLADHFTKLSIVNNYAHDIQSVVSFDNTNAAVFVDARGVESRTRGDSVISFNQIERLQGLKGQDDSNAIYAKAWGLIVQGNHIEKSGAAYLDAKRNGSEASGILVKPVKNGVARDIEVVGNTFVDMPSVPAGVVGDVSVIKVSEAVGNSSISFNTFIGGGNVSGSLASGVIRWYGTYENLKIVGNAFTDVNIGTNDNAVVLHQLVTTGVGAIEVSNNSATRTAGDYLADARLVYFNGAKPKSLATGHNTLDGGHAMGLSLPGTGTAAAQAYQPPLVLAPGTIEGRAGSDRLFGTPGDDVLNALGSSDVIFAGAGDDLIVAGAGNDTVDGGEGSDTLILIGTRAQYAISATTATDFSITDAVRNRDGTDTVTGVEFVDFADALHVRIADLLNHAPRLAAPVADQDAVQGAAFRFLVPGDTFADPDAADGLVYRAVLLNGAALPAWLSFDPATRGFSGTPGVADVGMVQVRLIATDPAGQSAADDFTLTVRGIDRAPATSPEPEGKAGIEDGTLYGRLAAGSDPDGDPFVYELVAGSSLHGTAVVNPDGSYSFAPDKDFAGEARFEYRLRDAQLESPAKTVALTFSAVNDAPVAAPSSLRTSEDSAVASKLQAADVDGDPLVYEILAGPAHGEVVVGGDGTATYTPGADFSGRDGFSYRVGDGTAESGTAVVDILVEAVADAPTIVSDGGGEAARLSVAENATAVTALAASDADPGDQASFSVVGGADRALFAIGEDGLLAFLAPPDFENPADDGRDNVYDVVVQASDGSGLADRQAISVVVGDLDEALPSPGSLAVGRAGVAEDDRVTLAITMDPQPRSDLRTVIVVTDIPDGWLVAENGGRYDAALGTWTIEVAPRAVFSGGPTLAPPADSDADSPLFSVTAFNVDGKGVRSGTVGLTTRVEVDAVADTPLLTLTDGSGAKGAGLALGIAAAVADRDGSETLSDVFVRGLPAGFALSAGTDKGGGEWRLAQGDLSGLAVSAPRDFVGTLHLTVEALAEESRLSGLEGNLADNVAHRSGQLTLVWAPVNEAPVLTGARAVLASGIEGRAYTTTAADLLAGFTDADGDRLSVTGLTADHGVAADNGNGTFTITPAPNYRGVMTLGYSVADGRGGSTPATQRFTLAENTVLDGTPGADTLTAPTSSDWTLNGLGGNDALTGAAGNDVLNGGAGNDSLDGKAGRDQLFGGDGNDRLASGYNEGNDVLDGGAGTDTALITRSAGASRFALGDPAGDTVFGGTTLRSVEQAIFFAGKSDDALTGGALADQFYASDGNDTLTGLGGNDLLNGGDGSDTAVFTGKFVDYKIQAVKGGFSVTGEGTDQLNGIEKAAFADGTYDFAKGRFTSTVPVVVTVLNGTSGIDTLVAPSGANWTLNGLGAADTLTGAAGNDVLNGGDGNDSLDGKAGRDQLFGGDGNDRLGSGSGEGDDLLDGGAGTDTALIVRYAGASTFVLADPAAETVFGDSRLKSIEQVIFYGGSNGDRLTGGALADQLYGNAGNDTLTGRGGNDILNGGAGMDTLDGGLGSNQLAGGAGADIFVFSGPATMAKTNLVGDFSSAAGDKLRVSAADYGLRVGQGLNVDGGLSADYFEIGAATRTGHGEFVLNTATRTLSWDTDGAGAGAAVALSDFTIPSGTAAVDFLKPVDFLVV